MAQLLEHKHLIVRAKINKPPTCPEEIQTWIRNLISAIGMKIAMGPYAYYSNMEGNRGLTAVTIIETSHMTLHCWDEVDPALLEFDLYTCSTLDKGIVMDALEYFQPSEVSFMILDREYDLDIMEKGKFIPSSTESSIPANFYDNFDPR